jgi:uncharacterized protein (DUF1499 family)
LYVQNASPSIELGVQDGRFAEIPESPNCVSTQTAQTDKLVEPIAFIGTLEESKEAFKNAITAYGGIKIVEETEDYIYAVATTSLMQYKDDIEIYFDQENEVIHYRSASRTGYSDMGLNKNRYDELKKLYSQ